MEKKCKKCERILPDGYKKKLCESCNGKRAQGLKEIGKGAVGVAALAIAFVAKALVSKDDEE